MRIGPRGRLAAVLLAAVALVAACGDDDDDVSPTPGEQEASDAPATSAPPAAETVTVTGVDYAFEGLPAQIDAGTKVEFVNASSEEVHEFVAIRIPDTETRPVSELVRLPESELDAIFGAGPPATVLVAGPNRGQVIPAVGDGTISQPGRYAVVCFIPTGVDPAVYFEAVQNATDGPPDIPDAGPPHAANGMFAELVVK